MKYINFKRYKFSTVVKTLNTLRYNFFKIFKSIDINIYNFKKIYKYFDIRRYNIIKFTKYLNPNTYNFSNLKKIDFISSKFLFVHFPIFVVFFLFLYLLIPTFYNYDKSDIAKTVCKNINIKCAIKGKVKYRFYPSPRLKINDLIVNEISNPKKTLIKIKDGHIKLSFKNLLAKDKHKFTKLELSNFETNINVKKIKEYKKILNRKYNLIPIIFKKGQITFHEGNNYIASISEANIKTKFLKDSIDSELTGKFLNDDLYINFSNNKKNKKLITDLIFKMSNLNFLTKANFSNSEKDQDMISGNFLIKKEKNKIVGIFDYKNNRFTINNSDIKNTLLNGELEGEVTLLPYFDFDLSLNLSSLNFTKLYNYFLSLDAKSKINLFKINNKINGKINLSADKIYSSYNLIKSFESRLKFYNGNISVEQFLLNLGKLGAGDILGTVVNDKKFVSFKFESNIFVDNQKKFLSKFGIYGKKTIHPSLYISGNLDLENIRASFYDISTDKSLNNEDINFIEKEFNDLMLVEGYKYLFNFQKFKEFIKSITSETN